MPAGVLSLHEELDGHYDGVPLCVDPGAGQPIMIIGMVNLCYRSTKYQSGTVAVQSLQEVIGPNQAGDFMGIMDPVYYHDLELLEYHGPGGTPQPQETPALQPDAYPDMRSDVLKAVWSTAYVNDLPDSSFLLIESGGEKDEDGNTKPRSLRHFPYKDSDGSVDLPHLRNAVQQIPKAVIEGFDETKMKALQNKAKAMLEKETAKEEKAEKSVDLASLPTALLRAMFDGLEERYESGLTTADLPPDQMREHGREIFGELKKRVPHIKLESPLLEDPQPTSKPYISRIVKSQDSSLGDPEYMYVLSLVLEPNDGKDGAKAEPDFDNEIYDRHAIRKMAFRYVRKSRGIGIMHEGERLDDDIARVVQSFVIEDGWELTTDQGRDLKQGAWLLGAEVKRASPLGKAIASGELRAFSIDGLALKKPEKMAA